MEFVYWMIDLYMLAIVIRVFLSWVDANRYNPIVDFIFVLTDPVLVPLSRVIPSIGGVLDISPIIALFLISLLKKFLIILVGY